MTHFVETQRKLFRYIKALFDLTKTGQNASTACAVMTTEIASLVIDLKYKDQHTLLGDFVLYMIEYELAVNVNQTPNLAHVQTNGRKVITNPQKHKFSPVDYVTEIVHRRFPEAIMTRRSYDAESKRQLDIVDTWKTHGIRVNPVKASTDDEPVFYMDTPYGSIRLGNAD